MFSKKESETNSGVTVSGTYQSQLKKAFPAAKITTSVKSWPQVGNSWTFLILLKSFSILKFAMIQWLLSETCLSKFFCYWFFFFSNFYVVFIMKKVAFCQVVHISKCEFDTHIKIKSKSIVIMVESNDQVFL